MATRDKNAAEFERHIFETLRNQEFSSTDQEDNKAPAESVIIKDLGNGRYELVKSCPSCETGRLQMDVSTRTQTVMAQCTNYGIDKGCGSHKVLMPYNLVQKDRMVDVKEEEK